MTGARVLVVDDEAQILRLLRRTLEAHGYTIEAVDSGRSALDAAERRRPDAILLDLMLPDLDGLEVCRRLRERLDAPIVVLSARGEERAKVEALDLGADDYLTKPFGTAELLARLRVALRHAAGNPRGPIVQAGDLTIDLDRRLVSLAGTPLHLTPKEYDALKHLAQHAGRVVTHRTLLAAVWGPEYGEELHYLHVVVNQLRRKIEPDTSQPRYILTEPGVGYRFHLPD
ncbi:MAG TPA: response regulator transcription factor [bacterium]|nr:response regulator transcription factor [bacterium]